MAEVPVRRREVLILLSALAAGAILRLAFLRDLRGEILFQYPVLDSLEYLFWARSILEGHLLWNEVSIHSPLYPYVLAPLLAIFDHDLFPVRATQALVVGTGTILAVWGIARTCAGRGAAAVSAWLAATLWPLVFHDVEILVESPVVCLNALALLVLLRARGRPGRLAIAGILLGLSTITRPNAAAFIPVAAIWAAWPERRSPEPRGRLAIARFAAVCLGAAIVMAPVLLRNHAISEAWVLQANAGLNFYIGNSPEANGAPNVQAGRPWAKLVNMARARGLTGPAEQDAFYRGEALRWWRESPGAALALFARKVFLVWSAHETRPNLDLHYFRALSPALSLPWPGFGTLAPLALLGAGLALIRPRRQTLLLVFYAAVYTFATAAFVVSSRYRLPLVSAAIPLAGIAAADLAARLKDRAWRSALIRAAALAALAIAVRPVPADVRVSDHAEERYNEGTVLLGLGRNREAEAVFRAAWAERQDDGRIANNLGALLVRTGRAREAVGWLREAVRLYPEVPDAWSNLGAALALTGNLEEAKRAYRESLKIDPNRGGTRLALGAILLQEGDRAGARRELEAARALGVELPPAEREALGAGEPPPGAAVP